MSAGFSVACPQHLGSTGSGTVDKAWTTPPAACPAPMPVPRAARPRRRNIARFKSEPAPRGPAPNIALFMRRRSARHMVHDGPEGSGAARPQEEMEKGDVPLLGGADPGEPAPALKWAMFGHGDPRLWPRRHPGALPGAGHAARARRSAALRRAGFVRAFRETLRHRGAQSRVPGGALLDSGRPRALPGGGVGRATSGERHEEPGGAFRALA